MKEKYQDKYRIPSARLQGYDYGSDGPYFITICTKNRIHHFGDIVGKNNIVEPDVDVETDNYPSLRPTIIGKTAINYWLEIPKHYPFVELDEFVVMPNHIHGILFFNRPGKTDWQPNQFGVQSQNLGAIIRAFKSTTKRYANNNNIEFEWQSRYHDRIIRNEKELNAVRQYIVDNRLNWKNDNFNMPHAAMGNYLPLHLETKNLLKEI